MAPELHPGAADVEHRAAPDGIARIEVAAEAREVHEWIGDHDLPLAITEGIPALLSVAIGSASGELVLPSERRPSPMSDTARR